MRKLDAARGRRLREELERQGYRFRDVAHATFAAAGPGVNVVLYESGKLVVQGKGASDFAIAFVDDPDEILEGRHRAPEDRVVEPIIGTDKSGKGDYFGPLVVAAILVKPEDVAVLETLEVRDSKTVGDAEAAEIARQLRDAYPGRIAVVCPSVRRYNEMHGEFGKNLNNLLAWMHAAAVQEVLRTESCARVISDQFGNERLLRDALAKSGIQARLEQRPRAESHPAVAAASILARARFLAELRKLGHDSGFKLPKGAGPQVDATARQIIRDGGIEKLGTVAKLHFKTTDKAKGLL